MLLEQLLRVRVHLSACSVIACSATSAGFVSIREQSHVNTTVGSPQVLACEIGLHRLWVSFRGRLPLTPRAIVAVIVGSVKLASTDLAAAFFDHLCRRGRRGASCRAFVRPGPASWHAAFSVAQFGQTVVTQLWHRDATSQNHRWLRRNLRKSDQKHPAL